MTAPLKEDLKPAVNVFYAGAHPEEGKLLKSQLPQYFPNIAFKGSATTTGTAREMIMDYSPDIIFFDLPLWKDFKCTLGHYCSDAYFETIILSEAEIEIIETIQNAFAGYLIKPVKIEPLILIVRNVLRKIQDREDIRQNRHFIKRIIQKRLQEVPIGIPTIEGYEFLEVKEILLCEALRKYTRVVAREKTDIISSYNLGEFRNLLEPYGFFCPHRSYLINLRHIKKYHKEGTIYMTDGTCIPIAKRLKKAFLDLVNRL